MIRTRHAAVAVLLLGTLLTGPSAEAATPPRVDAVLEGRDARTDLGTLTILGRKLNKIASLSFLTREGGGVAGELSIVSASKGEIVLALPAGLPAGEYRMLLNPKKGDPITVDVDYRTDRLTFDAPVLFPSATFQDGATFDGTVRIHAAAFANSLEVSGGGAFGAGVRVDGNDASTIFAGNAGVQNGTTVGCTITTDTTTGPQLRFERGGIDTVDIGMSSSGAFVVEHGTSTVLSTSSNGSVNVGQSMGSGSLNVNGPAYNATTMQVVGHSSDSTYFMVVAPDTDILMLVNASGLELREGNASKPGGGSWAVFSDARLKRDVRDLDGALDRLLDLRSVTYEYIDPVAIHEAPGRHVGFVAQEVENVFPDWVAESDNGMKTVAVKGFESLAVAALRELRAEKDAEIATLHDENAVLRARLDRLEAAVERIAGTAPACAPETAPR